MLIIVRISSTVTCPFPVQSPMHEPGVAVGLGVPVGVGVGVGVFAVDTNTSSKPLVSPKTRLLAAEVNAT
jgi:sorbitol-specific phosphotransferase system component IIBC